MPNAPRLVRLLGVAAALTVGAAAGPFAGVDGPAPADLTPRASHAPHARRAAAARVVSVVARDYAFDVPDTLAAGRTEFQLANKGAELHHAYLVRLDAGRTPADAFAALKAGGPPPAWMHDAGGPNAPAPGGTSAAVVDLVPGTYLMLCVVPSPDGTPHVMKGMSHAFTVKPGPVAPGGGATSAAAPTITGAPDVTLTLNDYGFALSRPLTRGRHVVRVRNAAAQSHEVFVGRLAPGKSTADVVAWVEYPQGPPPLLPLGGTVALARGATSDAALDLAPGEYGLFCFVPDAGDGRPHTAHGMVRQIAVR